MVRARGEGRGVRARVRVRARVCGPNHSPNPDLDPIAQVWRMDTWEQTGTLSGHRGLVLALACYGDRLISGSDDRCIRVWRLGTWECERTLTGHNGGVVGACSPLTHDLHPHPRPHPRPRPRPHLPPFTPHTSPSPPLTFHLSASIFSLYPRPHPHPRRHISPSLTPRRCVHRPREPYLCLQ